MKCPRCGVEYPSKYYLKTPSLCLTCYENLSPGEKVSVDEEAARLLRQRNRMRRQRSFGALIVLSIVTLGIYYLYWLYVNLAELGTLAAGDDVQQPVRRGKFFFFLYLTLTVVGLFYAVSVVIHYFGTGHGVIELSPLVWLLVALQAGIELGLYYFFSLSIVRGLAFVTGRNEPVSRLYAWIVAVIALDIVTAMVSPGPEWRDYRDYRLGAILPLGLVSIGFMLTYLYRCQTSINQIWGRAEGTAAGA